MKLLVFYFAAEMNKGLSYQHGWPRAIANSARVKAKFINLADTGIASEQFRAVFFQRYDAIVLLHSVFSNSRYMSRAIQYLIRLRRLPVVYFIGNEYKSMPAKMKFCETLGVSLLISQTAHKGALDLYRSRLKCAVTSIPAGGLDPDLFKAGPPISERPIDVGFRAYEEPFYFGHQERHTLMTKAQGIGARLRLTMDLSMNPEDRLVEGQWVKFLQKCKTMLGTYSGYDYFEIDDALRLRVIAYTHAYPKATFADVYRELFAGKPKGVTARMIAGRHIEAAGARTAQILIEGDYSGFLRPNEHYIPVRVDFANLEEALEKSRDSSLCQSIADRAYDVVTQELTFDRHIDRLCHHLEPLCN